MTYEEVMATILPRLVRDKAAGKYVGAPRLLELMEAHKWVRPVTAEHRMKLYDIKMLDRCIERLAAGEFPGR